MRINIKLDHPAAKIPTRAHETDAGWDLYPLEDFILYPNTRRLINTGLILAIPEGHYGHICPRSGLSLKSGLFTMAGVLDSSYRGNVGVILYNSDTKPYQGTTDKAIAQLIIKKYEDKVEWVAADDVEKTERADNGFGSSDKWNAIKNGTYLNDIRNSVFGANGIPIKKS